MEKGNLLKTLLLSVLLTTTTNSFALRVFDTLDAKPSIGLVEDISVNILTLFQTLTPGQTMNYPYQGVIYKIYLSPEGVFHIQDKNNTRRQLDKIKIDFDRRVSLCYPLLSKERKKTIDVAKKGIAIRNISQLRITGNNLDINIYHDNKEYFCSIPIQYFYKILQNLTSPIIKLPHNTLEEIYGETEPNLDEETKKLYNQVHEYLNGLIVSVK